MEQEKRRRKYLRGYEGGDITSAADSNDILTLCVPPRYITRRGRARNELNAIVWWVGWVVAHHIPNFISTVDNFVHHSLTRTHGHSLMNYSLITAAAAHTKFSFSSTFFLFSL